MVQTGSSGTVRRTILCDASSATVWRRLSKIADLEWAVGVEKTTHLAGPKSGVGAARKIVFENGAVVKETVTGWVPGLGLSYIATEGLGVDAYHASISVEKAGAKSRIIWESVFADKSESKVAEFRDEIGKFYSQSLRRLRDLVQTG